jgi:hypothetical protein
MYIEYKQFYTFEEAAEVLGIQTRRVGELINRGLLESRIIKDETGGYRRVVEDSALDDFMRNYPTTWRGLRYRRARPKKELVALTWIGENDEYFDDLFERGKKMYEDQKRSDEW